MTKEELEAIRRKLNGYFPTLAVADAEALLAHIDELTEQLECCKAVLVEVEKVRDRKGADLNAAIAAKEKAEGQRDHEIDKAYNLAIAVGEMHARAEKAEAERDRFRKALEEIADMPPAFNLGWKVATDTLNGDK